MFEEKKAALDDIGANIKKAQTAASDFGSHRSLQLPADVAELDRVLAFLDECLEEAGCGSREQMQLEVALEEMFVNVAHYAYGDKQGEAVIAFHMEGDMAVIELRDRGLPFDPTKREDPDTTLSAEERQIGGLGIYMVKKSMDAVVYARTATENILTLCKKIR